MNFVPFDAVPGDIQTDVQFCVAAQFPSMDEREVLELLENGPAVLPLVDVSPRSIWPGEDHCRVSNRVVGVYAGLYKRGVELPPVVIDRKLKKPLCEGCHRTQAAIRAGKKSIPALDLTGARIVRTSEGLETFDFALHRIPSGPSLGAAPPGMKPLLEILQELAEAHPGTRLAMMTLGWDVPGFHPDAKFLMPVENWVSYFLAAIEHPTLRPRARAKLTGPFFHWARDDAGVWTVMVYYPALDISEPFMQEETTG